MKVEIPTHLIPYDVSWCLGHQILDKKLAPILYSQKKKSKAQPKQSLLG